MITERTRAREGHPGADAFAYLGVAPNPVPQTELEPAHTIASYFDVFSPAPPWSALCEWPPDVFALCNLVLDHTDGSRFAVAPPPGTRWPPRSDWNDLVQSAAREWQAGAGAARGAVPAVVQEHWDIITELRDTPLGVVRERNVRLNEALLTLHAIADEACAGLSRLTSSEPFAQRAWQLLDARGSLSRISPGRIRVIPKTHFATRGITIRSLSRYLALYYESVDVRWHRIQPFMPLREAVARRSYNIVLLPWPLRVRARDFRPIEGPLSNMDDAAFGFFEFSPDEALDVSLLDGLFEAAHRSTPRIDAVILPEAALERRDIPLLEARLAAHGVPFVIAGVRERATSHRLGANYLHIGVLTTAGWQHYEQQKHHRWCLDGPQIRQYHLSRTLDPGKQWWEAIDLPPRAIQVLDVGGGVTTVPLICEDLARLDETSDLLRRLGPSLVVALLLDGPQLSSRWPFRYASIFADDPGSSVLTLTSFGMASRSSPPGFKRSRVVALWNDPRSGVHEIELARGAGGILMTASAGRKTTWTADGRRHDGVPDAALTGVVQLRLPPQPRQ